jgi:hypothetical protein
MSFDIINSLRTAKTQVKLGKLYYHYKDPKKYYRVNHSRDGPFQGVVNEADLKIMVIYNCYDNGEVSWARPPDVWLIGRKALSLDKTICIL